MTTAVPCSLDSSTACDIYRDCFGTHPLSDGGIDCDGSIEQLQLLQLAPSLQRLDNKISQKLDIPENYRPRVN